MFNVRIYTKMSTLEHNVGTKLATMMFFSKADFSSFQIMFLYVNYMVSDICPASTLLIMVQYLSCDNTLSKTKLINTAFSLYSLTIYLFTSELGTSFCFMYDNIINYHIYLQYLYYKNKLFVQNIYNIYNYSILFERLTIIFLYFYESVIYRSELVE